MRSIGVLIAGAGVLLNLTAAYGLPKQIIILRHAEKTDDKPLCDTGEKRAEALKHQYLGQSAKDSLFANGELPAAFYANSGHSALTLGPAVETWNDKGVKLYKRDNIDEDTWSRNAANNVLKNAEYNGKIVVMAWEHHRIADVDLDNRYCNDPLTLYRLLGIYNYPDKVVNDVDLSNWCGSNYDFFWIVDYDPDHPNYKNGAPTPIRVTPRQQTFNPPGTLPTNAWGAPESPQPEGCAETKKPICPNHVQPACP